MVEQESEVWNVEPGRYTVLQGAEEYLAARREELREEVEANDHRGSSERFPAEQASLYRDRGAVSAAGLRAFVGKSS
ncbi:hypothetical protein NQK81_02580 [Amycolatopsis roodepoortensis]|uniref:hypothetical protein n=1 Tax=Amycolatopsis roodepoortensis TaxID=700274 RepID=UPI00214CF266|nr:hypothetical protein [Amycolatopsis roodepoortensis]UUV32360.1 hypothetical protein NQK81_02580 [Amycolatopsis roodepoortensis]